MKPIKIQEPQVLKYVSAYDTAKDSILSLAREHKKICEDPGCNISLYFIGLLLERVGFTLTDEEWAELV